MAKNSPFSARDIARALEQLGLQRDMQVLADVSISAMGWVLGAEQAVLQALLSCLDPQSGSLIFPAFSSQNSEPSHWQCPPVPRSWHDKIRRDMPAFCATTTPTRDLGRTAESFRKYPGVERSSHPQTSFCAWGKNSKDILKGQSLSRPLGNESPLGFLYRAGNAYELLLGVGGSVCTSLHLAEEMLDLAQTEAQGARVADSSGGSCWQVWQQIPYSSHDFPQIFTRYAAAATDLRCAQVGKATAYLYPVKSLVDFALNDGLLEQNRREAFNI